MCDHTLLVVVSPLITVCNGSKSKRKNSLQSVIKSHQCGLINGIFSLQDPITTYLTRNVELIKLISTSCMSTFNSQMYSAGRMNGEL